jgi:hypothetical protein
MKKPTRRNAGKALCAYFTHYLRPFSLDIFEGKGAWVLMIFYNKERKSTWTNR